MAILEVLMIKRGGLDVTEWYFSGHDIDVIHLFICSSYNSYIKAEQWQLHKIVTPWANRVGKVV